MAEPSAGPLAVSKNGNVPNESSSSKGREFANRLLASSGSFGAQVRQWWPYYAMMAPGLIFFIIWHYVPIWEAKMAFEQVRIIPPNVWVGWKNFQLLFSSPIFYQVLANTLIISGMKILFVFPVPIIVALLLNEIRSGKLRGTLQSAIYLPHFLSWVVISACSSPCSRPPMARSTRSRRRSASSRSAT